MGLDEFPEDDFDEAGMVLFDFDDELFFGFLRGGFGGCLLEPANCEGDRADDLESEFPVREFGEWLEDVLVVVASPRAFYDGGFAVVEPAFAAEHAADEFSFVAILGIVQHELALPVREIVFPVPFVDDR